MDNNASVQKNPTVVDNYYRLAYYEYFKNSFKNVVVDNTQSNKFLIIDASVDPLSFMEEFEFPELSKLKTSLVSSGYYTQEQVSEIIEGLSTLPEYNE